MSLQLTGSVITGTWAVAGDPCFHCGEALEPGDLAVAWSGNDQEGIRYWHARRCAAEFAAAFMRDVWEAGHALRGPEPDLSRYSEPEWRARQ